MILLRFSSEFLFSFIFLPSAFPNLKNVKSIVEGALLFSKITVRRSQATLGFIFLMQARFSLANDPATRRAIRRDREKAKEAELSIGKRGRGKKEKEKRGEMRRMRGDSARKRPLNSRRVASFYSIGATIKASAREGESNSELH